MSCLTKGKSSAFQSKHFILFKEKLPAAKKRTDNVDGYTRDDAEIEIMIREEVRIGTLACTATEPLKVRENQLPIPFTKVVYF